jgi:dTDP-4-amino-4,6-dideoxygalactose transaminase
MMSNVLAGIGRGQMEVLDERLKRRQQIHEIYRQELTNEVDMFFPEDLPHAVSNRWLSVGMLLARHKGAALRDGLHDYLAALNIETRPVWRPMHLQPAYQHFPYFGGRQAEMLHTFGICLPSGSSLTESQQGYVIDNIKRYFRQASQQKPVMKVG